jgi:hypothetical protein
MRITDEELDEMVSAREASKAVRGSIWDPKNQEWYRRENALYERHGRALVEEVVERRTTPMPGAAPHIDAEATRGMTVGSHHPVSTWGCTHGYTMPHADTLCPHCCPLAWRSGTTYSRDEHVAALEAMEFSARMATIEECVKVAAATQGGADSCRDMRDRIVRSLRALREVKA